MHMCPLRPPVRCCQVVAGSELTGPSMNPAHAFSWYYFLQVMRCRRQDNRARQEWYSGLRMAAHVRKLSGCGVFAQGHDRFQHLAVFWAAPLGGALAAGLTWNALTAPSSRRPATSDAKKEL